MIDGAFQTGRRARLVVCIIVASTGFLAPAHPSAAQQRTKPLDPRIDSLFPVRPAAYVTDLAHIVANATAVDAHYAAIRASIRLPIVAVTLPSTRGYPPYEVAMEIGRKWMVALANDTLGATARHTGAVVLLVLDTHQCFVATAYGSEGYLTDTEAHAICSSQNAAFRAGDFGRGLVAIADSIAAHSAADQGAARATPSTPATREVPADDGRLPFLLVLIVIVAGVATATFFSARHRSTAERMRLARLTPAERKAERQARRKADREARRQRRRMPRDTDEARRRGELSIGGGIDLGSSFDGSPGAAAPDSGPSLGGSDAFGGGGGGGSWDS